MSCHAPPYPTNLTIWLKVQLPQQKGWDAPFYCPYFKNDQVVMLFVEEHLETTYLLFPFTIPQGDETYFSKIIWSFFANLSKFWEIMEQWHSG